MFRGINSINLDAKGRLAVPTRYRDALSQRSSGQMVLTIDASEDCLLLYPMAEWEVIENQIMALPGLNEDVLVLKRKLIGYATETELDASGRILIPALHRDHAHIDKKVTFLGQGKKFELWGEEHWNVRRADWDKQKAPLSEAARAQLGNIVM